MTILRPSLDTQTITVIARYDSSDVTLTLLNEETQVLNSFDISTTYSNGYLGLEFEFTPLEAESFNLEIKDGDIVLFRGKAFATDETDLENYKISKNSIL
jgi:hypothetical protein